MKTGWKSLMVAGVVLAVLAGQALAQRGPGLGRGPARGRGAGMGLGRQPAGPRGPGGVFGPIAAQLNLTAEQRGAIRDICQQSRADANDVLKAIDSARAELHKAVIGGATEEQIRAAAAKLGTAIGNQAVLQGQTIAKAKAVLTPEQLKQFEELKTSVPPRRRPQGGPAGMQMQRPGWAAGPGRGPKGLQMQRPRWGGGPGGGPKGLQMQRPRWGGGPGGGPTGMQMQRPGWGAGPGPAAHLGLEQMFKRADTNNDGVLSLKELRAFRENVGTPRGPWYQ